MSDLVSMLLYIEASSLYENHNMTVKSKSDKMESGRHGEHVPAHN